MWCHRPEKTGRHDTIAAIFIFNRWFTHSRLFNIHYGVTVAVFAVGRFSPEEVGGGPEVPTVLAVDPAPVTSLPLLLLVPVDTVVDRMLAMVVAIVVVWGLRREGWISGRWLCGLEEHHPPIKQR
jgi:hypothetical protein